MNAIAEITARVQGLLAQGKHAEALALAEGAYKRGNSPQAGRLLGLVLVELGEDERAVYVLERVKGSFPMDAAVVSSLAAALGHLGRYREALPCFRDLWRANPSNAELLRQLLLVLIELGEVEEACTLMVPAVQACRTSGDLSYLGRTLASSGSPQRLIDLFAHLRSKVGSIAELEHAEMLSWMYVDDPTGQRAFEAHVRCGKTMAAQFPADPRPFSNTRDPQRPIRVGYVSQDFRNRSAGHFAESLITGHDRASFPVWCYHRTIEEDELTGRLKAAACGWRDVAKLDDRAIADLIRSDQIDILVDLTGHGGMACLIPFCFRPAPVQVSYMGYPHSTGLPMMDYRIVDALTDPPGYERQATEKLVRLEGCFLCYTPPEHAPEVSPPPSARNGIITFGSFNTSMKVTARVLDLWARVLKAVPGSRLLLKARGLTVPERAREIVARLKSAGIDAKRVTCRGETATPEEHLRAYAEVDIALDPFPYNGTTTTLEALWMGVPVVTLAGASHRARVGLSLLTNAGFPELVAANEGEYVRIAAELAGDPAGLCARRGELRAKLAESTVCDRPRFVRNVEGAYREMWRAWCGGRS